MFTLTSDIVNKYQKTYTATKMKFVDVNFRTNIDFDKENNEKGSKFEFYNCVKTLKKEQ